MLYFFKILFLLINIDQETVLNWFEIENSVNDQGIINTSILTVSNSQESINVLVNLVNKFQNGLTIENIGDCLFFILCVRFIILALRYNSKTSFYITCISILAGFLWYNHLFSIIETYSNVLNKVPFLQNLQYFDGTKINMEMNSTNPSIDSISSNFGADIDISWFEPGKIIYTAIMRGIIHVDYETGRKYFIDPFSMIISKFQGSVNSDIIEFYYQLYKKIIPNLFNMASKFWDQLSGIAAYAVITRLGKRYCPYLIRWHWTFLLIIMMPEQIFITFINRANYFLTQILIPQTYANYNYINFSFKAQIVFFNLIIILIVSAHIGFLIFGLFHAISGQYFYLPFFVENTELHVGPRPSNSIYSGGNTSWQDPAEKENPLNRRFPKVWYGWFGRGTQNEWVIASQIKNFFNRMIKNFKRQFRQ
jgi:hypothetical protein